MAPRGSATTKRVAVAVVVLLLASVAGFTGAVDAGLLPPSEPGTGSVSGVVTGPGGEPLAGATVFAEGASFHDVQTEADGSYLIEGLAAGYYIVAFTAPEGSTLAGEYYDDSYEWPTPVEVLDETETPGIDAELAEGTTITGTVTDPDGLPYAGAQVYAERWGFGFQGGAYAFDLSGADGGYELNGLSPGYYRVHVSPPFNSPYVPQYYDGVYNHYEATPLLAQPPAPITGIDVQLGLGGSIGGTVTDDDGAPLEGVQVSVEGDDFGGAMTGADGTYVVDGLTPGSYVVHFQPGTGFLPEYYDNVTSFVEATHVPVEAGELTAEIDAVLAPGAAIAGQVIGLDGLPDSNVQVWATTPSGQPLRMAATNFNGQYFINDLPSGDVVVEFRQPFNTQFYDGVYRRAEATPVTLTGGIETTGIDAVFDAIVIGTQLPANDTTVETYCFDDDALTFVFDVTDLDPSGGVTGGTVDFGDGSTPWVFDATGDTIEHTYPDPSSLPTPPAYEVTLTLTGGGSASDSVSFMPGATDCRAGTTAPIFSDVPASSPFFDAIQWMAEEGITNGFADGTFRPKLDVTREGVAAWLYGFAGSPSVSGSPVFSDVPASSPFFDAIQWMAEEGITNGFADGTFRPKLDITREGVAAWLYQYDQTLP